MAGTKISDGSVATIVPVGTEFVPLGNGVSKIKSTTQNIANLLNAWTTTATTGGTTTLTISSTPNQDFTGTLAQTILMPVASTCSTNPQTTFYISNRSSNTITVQSSGGNTIQAMAPGTYLTIQCILTSGTGTSSWNAIYSYPSPLSAIGSLIQGGTAGALTELLAVAGPAILTSTNVGTTLTWVKGVTGVTDASNAAAGVVGETVSSLIASGSATSLTTATAKNITSISLTAGDWDVVGNINFTETTSTVTARSGGISTTTATVPSDGSECYNGVQSTVTSEINTISLPVKRINVNATTTVYLVGSATFSAGTCSGFGSILARRVR